MAARTRNEATDPVRWRPRGVEPLEVWDFVVGERTIWEWREEPQFPELLLEMLIQLRAGEGRTRSKGPVGGVARGFGSVFVAGGGALDRGLRRCLERAPFPVTCCDEGPFSSERGGRLLLSSWRGAAARETGMVVDVGQVEIKVSVGGRRWRFPRDFRALPIAQAVAAGELPVQRERLRSFVGESLGHAAREAGGPPGAIILALPCELGGDVTPGSCSYAGMAGDAALARLALERAGLSGVPTRVLNDAELASVSARSYFGRALGAKTLVVTLGFGVGAAVLTSAS